MTKTETELQQRVTELENERDKLKAELTSLAQSLFNRHFAHSAPYVTGEVKWEPFDEPANILSQIDNMTSGMTVVSEEDRKDLQRLQAFLTALVFPDLNKHWLATLHRTSVSSEGVQGVKLSIDHALANVGKPKAPAHG